MPARATGHPALLSLAFEHPQAAALGTLVTTRMLDRGFLVGGGFYPSLAHEDWHVDACLDALYRRWYPQVARWCLRIAGDRERAAELAQEVFLRVHGRLDGFRGESRFSTWLYAVTRSVAINRGIAERRRREEPLDAESAPEPADPRPGAAEDFESAEAAAWMRSALAEALEPEEAKVLYLHYALGLTLPAITALLRLDNKSGAKAYIVSGRRKLVRRYGERGPLSAAGRTP